MFKWSLELEKELYLGSENIQSKAIETTNNSLLNIQSKVIQSPHGRKQKSWSSGTKHMNVDRSPFPYPNFHL